MHCTHTYFKITQDNSFESSFSPACSRYRLWSNWKPQTDWNFVTMRYLFGIPWKARLRGGWLSVMVQLCICWNEWIGTICGFASVKTVVNHLNMNGAFSRWIPLQQCWKEKFTDSCSLQVREGRELVSAKAAGIHRKSDFINTLPYRTSVKSNTG
jgi:hypothetical protein